MVYVRVAPDVEVGFNTVPLIVTAGFDFVYSVDNTRRNVKLLPWFTVPVQLVPDVPEYIL
jgi:hypothetical protein